MLPSEPLRRFGPGIPYPTGGCDGLDAKSSPNKGLRGKGLSSFAKSVMDCDVTGACLICPMVELFLDLGLIGLSATALPLRWL